MFVYLLRIQDILKLLKFIYQLLPVPLYEL
jgi:hypothetical protein